MRIAADVTMHHHQDTLPLAPAQQDESFVSKIVIGISQDTGKIIAEYGLRFLKSNSVFSLIDSILVRVPLKP